MGDLRSSKHTVPSLVVSIFSFTKCCTYCFLCIQMHYHACHYHFVDHNTWYPSQDVLENVLLKVLHCSQTYTHCNTELFLSIIFVFNNKILSNIIWRINLQLPGICIFNFSPVQLACSSQSSQCSSPCFWPGLFGVYCPEYCCLHYFIITHSCGKIKNIEACCWSWTCTPLVKPHHVISTIIHCPLSCWSHWWIPGLREFK